MRDLFPEVEPYKTQRLKVSPLHELYIEEVGNPEGQPVLFLHGGPGAGLSKKHRRFFDPKHYRIVLFDQRGAGKSTPHASLEENTTWHLVDDIEKIRNQLGISKWVVFGGSWGSTLALAYAQTHPQSVSGLVLRGIFLCRPEEINWFYQKGCDLIFPDLWEDYIKPIAPDERHEMVKAYYRRLTSSDEKVRVEAARAWSVWEGSTIKLLPDPQVIASFGEEHMAVSIARIECHYFINNCWFKNENQLVDDVDKIRNIPTVIVHGRYDVVCPIKNAWDLHKAWPEAEFKIIHDAGHAADEPGIINALIEATEKFKKLQ
ncbi:MAG: prolyl aminopeptidase [Oligoflexia bacterium]|nr:prolyl aminopeptidase [Oligoflexia bacterium]